MWFTTTRSGVSRDVRWGMARGLMLRMISAAILAVGVWTGTTAARAADVEYLMVPSGAMGRDIPVAFMGGGPHAVYLLDAFNAGDTVSNWVTAGNAMNTLAGKGISVVAPASGAYSLYTNWEQDGSRQWETFLSSELPDWLAANKGLAPNGHAAVGAAQGGTGAMTDGLMRFGGVDTRNMWGLPQLGRWKWHDPWVHAALLADNNTRIWVFSPQTLTASDPAAMIGYPDQAQGTNRMFYQQYRAVGGHNGHFDFPTGGDHGWSSWGPQLAAMSGDLVAAIK